MCTYLHGPREGGTYYFRRAVPADLRPLIGQREWFFSLATKDRAAAKELVAIETVRTNAILRSVREEQRKQRTLQPRSPAASLAQQELERSQWEYDQGKAALDAELNAEDDARLEQADALAARLARPFGELTEDERAALFLIDHYREDRDQYRTRYRRRKRRDAGAVNSPAVPSALFQQVKAETRPNEGAVAQISISDLYRRYSSQDALSPSTVEQWRSVIAHLIAFLGFDDALRVTTDDLLRWRVHLRDEVSKSGKPRSSKTINGTYLAAANVLFSYGFVERLLSHNPMTDVSNVRAERKVQLREKSFTLDERRTILTATLKPQSDRLSPHRMEVIRWVPWICAYTGARVNEITQLRKQDFMDRDGVWSMLITPEAGHVKTDQARTVPVHEHLTAQGLREFVEACPDGPLFYSAPTVGRGRRTQYQVAGQRLAEWVRSLGIDDRSVKPNHAWRHTFKTICREVGIDEGAADYIQGHAPQGVSRSYGSNNLQGLAAQLAKFPRFA